MTAKKNLKPLFRTLLLCSVLSLFSCGSKPKVEKITPDIPIELEGLVEVEDLISEMSDVVYALQKNMAKAVKFSIAQDKSESDSLTMKQGLKVGVVAAKMMLAQKKMEEIKDEALLLKPELSEDQWIALESILAELESNIGNLDPETLGLSEEELIQLKAGEGLQFGNVEPSPDQREMDSIQAFREEAIEQMKAEGIYEEPEETTGETKDVPLWLSIAFPVFVIGLIIFIFIFTIKTIVKKVKKSAGNFSYIKNEITKRTK